MVIPSEENMTMLAMLMLMSLWTCLFFMLAVYANVYFASGNQTIGTAMYVHCRLVCLHVCIDIVCQGFTYVAPSVMDSLNREIPMSPWRYTRYLNLQSINCSLFVE